MVIEPWRAHTPRALSPSVVYMHAQVMFERLWIVDMYPMSSIWVQDIYQILINISIYFVYSTISHTSHMLNIQLLTYNVTVLYTTTMLVTIFLVCLCSRHNKGRFWSLFGVLQKVLPWTQPGLALCPLGGLRGPYFDQVRASEFM